MALPLVPILGYTALAGGLGTATVGAAGHNEALAKLLRMDPARRAEGETFDRTTGRVKNYDFGDFVLSSLLGQDEGDINAEAQKISDKKLLKTYGGDIQMIKDQLEKQGQLNETTLGALKPQRYQSADQFISKINSVKNHSNAVALADELDVDISDLTANGGLITQSQVKGRDRRRTTEKVDDRTRIADQRYDDAVTRQTDQQNMTNQLAISDREYRQWKDAKDDEWRRWSYQQQLADKRESRADRKQALIMQMQQSDLDRSYMRERDERADARADRKQRTAMLMQMVQGLSKLGYGMAI